jgi:YcxB-like protein
VVAEKARGDWWRWPPVVTAAPALSGPGLGEIEFDLRPEDMVAYWRQKLPGKAKALFLLLLTGLSPLVALGILGLIAGADPRGLLVGLLCGVTFLVLMSLGYFLVYPGIQARQLRKMYKGLEGRGIFQHQRLSLIAEGLNHATAHSRTTILWAAVDQIDETETHVFIHTGPIDAIIVPRRAFEEEWRYQELTDQVRQRHERMGKPQA